MADRRSAALFVTLGLVAAFMVSAIVGVEYADNRRAGSDPASDSLQADAMTLPVTRTMTVEVLNGAGRAGLARDATHRLRGDGFDVVFYGNAARFDHPTSMVLARTGDLARAREVAAALGIDSVAADPDASLLLDVTVVLGADWPPPTPKPALRFERLRRLLAPADPAR